MRIETVLLTLGIASIVAGSAFVTQKPVGHKSYPLEVFAQAKDEDYIGSSACAECHDEKVTNFTHSAHYAYNQVESLPNGKRGCEGCHGPGKAHKEDEENNAHIISYKKISPQEVADACLRCHETSLTMNQWHRTNHSRAKVACTGCHQLHPDTPNEFNERASQPLTIRRKEFSAVKSSSSLLKADEATLCASCHRREAAEFRKASHHPIPEGRQLCSDCHDPHPRKKEISRRELLKAQCVTCHTEYAGPFAFEHDPVAGHTGQGCAECHNPHGSNNPRLLNSFSRGLCAQCHTDKATLHFPGRTCWQAGCHVAIHGSNTDHRFFTP